MPPSILHSMLRSIGRPNQLQPTLVVMHCHGGMPHLSQAARQGQRQTRERQAVPAALGPNHDSVSPTPHRLPMARPTTTPDRPSIKVPAQRMSEPLQVPTLYWIAVSVAIDRARPSNCIVGSGSVRVCWNRQRSDDASRSMRCCHDHGNRIFVGWR